MTNWSRQGWLGYGTAVLGLHVLGLLALLPTARAHPAILGVGFLAYTLGLRHAFDADHISAIVHMDFMRVLREFLKKHRRDK